MKRLIFCLFSFLCFSSCTTYLQIYNETDREILIIDDNRTVSPGRSVYVNSSGRYLYKEIKIGEPPRTMQIREAYDSLANRLPIGARITIVSISAPWTGVGEYFIDELTSLLVNSNRFIIVDRRSLDAVRYEQYFQLSGEVDDNTAVSIGKLLGADIIINGSLQRTDNTLTLRAINVTTAQIIAMVTI